MLSIRARLSSLFQQSDYIKARLGSCCYDKKTISDLHIMMNHYNVALFNKASGNSVYRGSSVEFFLGSLAYGHLGPYAMKAGFVNYLQVNRLAHPKDLTPKMLSIILGQHLDGYDIYQGLSTKELLVSHTASPGVALGFALSADSMFSQRLIYKSPRDLGHSIAMHYPDQAGGMDETFPQPHIFSYQSEIVKYAQPHPGTELILLSKEHLDKLTLQDIKQAVRLPYPIFGESLNIDAVRMAYNNFEYLYLALEIEKVIAYEAYKEFVGNPNKNEVDFQKAKDLYDVYREKRKQQSSLIDEVLAQVDKNYTSHAVERITAKQWEDVASVIAPVEYNKVANFDDEGMTITLPGKEGETIVETFTNDQLRLWLAPYFEASPSTALDQLKHGERPFVANYIVQSVINKNEPKLDMKKINDLKLNVEVKPETPKLKN